MNTEQAKPSLSQENGSDDTAKCRPQEPLNRLNIDVPLPPDECERLFCNILREDDFQQTVFRLLHQRSADSMTTNTVMKDLAQVVEERKQEARGAKPQTPQLSNSKRDLLLLSRSNINNKSVVSNGSFGSPLVEESAAASSGYTCSEGTPSFTESNNNNSFNSTATVDVTDRGGHAIPQFLKKTIIRRSLLDAEASLPRGCHPDSLRGHELQERHLLGQLMEKVFSALQMQCYHEHIAIKRKEDDAAFKEALEKLKRDKEDGVSSDAESSDVERVWALTHTTSNGTDRVASHNLPKTILELYRTKIFQFAETNFLDIFAEGIAGSTLTDSDVLYLTESIFCLPYFFDGDMTGVRLPMNPAMRLTADSFAESQLFRFHNFLAAKAAIKGAQSFVPTVDGWRWKLIKYYYHRKEFDHNEPPTVRLALMCIHHCLETGEVIREASARMVDAHRHHQKDGPTKTDPEDAERNVSGDDVRRDFYQKCLEIEQRLHDFGGSAGVLHHSHHPHQHSSHTNRHRDEENTISMEYQRGEVIGSGGFGTVYRCTNTETGQFLALKEIAFRKAPAHGPLPQGAKGADDEVASLLVEVDTMKRLSHPNIVKYYGCRVDRRAKKVQVLMEYLPRNLREIAVNSKGGLNLKLIAKYGRQILSGLGYLHQYMIIHRDIKAANVLVSESGDVKLTDFGTAMAQTQTTIDENHAIHQSMHHQHNKTPPSGVASNGTPTNNKSSESTATGTITNSISPTTSKKVIAGTPLFLAPELLKGSLASESSDIWAFGCLLIELVTGGNRPWQQELQDVNGKMPPLDVVLFRINSATNPPQLPPSIATDLPADFMEVLYACLTLCPYERPAAHKLLSYKFFQADRQQMAQSDPALQDGVFAGCMCSYCMSMRGRDVAGVVARNPNFLVGGGSPTTTTSTTSMSSGPTSSGVDSHPHVPPSMPSTARPPSSFKREVVGHSGSDASTVIVPSPPRSQRPSTDSKQAPRNATLLDRTDTLDGTTTTTSSISAANNHHSVQGAVGGNHRPVSEGSTLVTESLLLSHVHLSTDTTTTTSASAPTAAVSN